MGEPTITSKNAAIPPAPATLPVKPVEEVSAAIPYDQIEAKPLRSPNYINLKPRNPNLCIYWGNRAVGEKESSMRYDQLLAMGFVPAEPKDVYSINPNTNQRMDCPESLCRNGRIMYGDVILLKIPRADYIGALKWNEQSARMRVKKPGTVVTTGASQDFGKDAVLREDSRKNPSPAGFPSKVNVFVPTLAETDARTADNSGPQKNLADGKPL